MRGTLMLFGPFRFALDSAAYDELQRRTTWEWAEQSLIGSEPAQQFTGKNAEEITMRGRLVPGWTGGVEQLARLRALGDMGRPLPLVDGMGRVYGLWVLTAVTETGTTHFRDGYPRIVEFELALRKYGSGTGILGLASKVSNLISLFR
jgi:uncharacterized protein